MDRPRRAPRMIEPHPMVFPSQSAPRVLVACPDARPPAYQAVVGLSRSGLLHSFLTAYYYAGGDGPLTALGRRLAPGRFARLQRVLGRRHDPEIPPSRVRSTWGYDLALGVERRLPVGRQRTRRRVARWRTEWFDRRLARSLSREGPGAALIFSDVGSECALPLCRARGIASVLSMVHGDVREERQLLEREAETSPDFFPIYLGDGRLDREELAWLHDRRLRDVELADRILVPSEHIAGALARRRPRDLQLARPPPPPRGPHRGAPPPPRHARRKDQGRPLRGRHPPVPPRPDQGARPGLHLPVRRGDHPTQGDQVPARGLAADPTPRLAAPAPRRPAARSRPAPRLSRRGGAAGASPTRRGP